MVMRLVFAGFGAALLATTTAVVAAEPVRSAAQNGMEVRADALELAQLLNPTEPMVALAGKSFDQAFDKGMAAEGGAAELEKEYPGIVAELRRASREASIANVRSRLPALHRRYGRFFA